MPHIHCYLMNPGLVWLHVISDLLIGLSYVAISGMLAYLVHRGRRDIPFHSMFLAFGLFIVACGATHFMEIWTLWHATYWLSGAVKAVTAAASVITAVALPPLVPLALGMIRAARISEERKQELEAAHAELSEVYTKLKEFDELKTQFFANVSHELRTPLALILGPTDRMLASDDLSDDLRQTLSTVNGNARLLLKHVNDLLDVSKLESGKMTAEYADVDLSRLTALTAAHFDALAQEREVAYSVDVPPSLAAQVDPQKLQQVLVNLLSNAFKFTPPGGTVRCLLQAAPPDATPARFRLTVQDSGPGVPPELREAIFERFQQGEGGANRRFGGTGLGLAIAKEFVELQGGTITVADAPGGGALFTVELPLQAPEGARVGPAPADLQAAAAESARGATEELRAHSGPDAASEDTGLPLVLVVEDNPEMNRFLSGALSDRFRTVTAHDGEEGLRKALELRPDLILSDVMMPGMSGDQMVRAARTHQELDAVPIVMLTAKADDELRVRLLREGAQDYVMKPCSTEELRARVHNLVELKRARELLQEELALQTDDLEVLVAEAAHRKRELQTAVASMRVARDQAERASQVKSDFLRMVSHELRTPLTTLQLQLQRLQRDRETILTPRQQEMVRRMSGASSRLLELIESLLQHARIESGRLDIHVEAVDLKTLAAETLDELRSQAEQKDLLLQIDAPPDLPSLQTDPRLLRLILVNLVGNALKFTEQGSIRLTLSHQAGAHQVAVTDTGAGIAAEQQAAIFEAFTQLEPVQNKHLPGVGLGLALVKEMVEALGGRIEVTSAIGKGSTFTVTLPPATAPV